MAFDGWGPEDIEALKKMTVDDFYQLFKPAKGIEMRRLITTALNFAKISPRQDDHIQIAKTAAAALVRIGQEPTINRLRVEKYGIKVSDHAGGTLAF